MDQFTGLVKNSFNQHFSDIVTDRLQTALTKETKIQNTNTDDVETDLEDSKIITTKDELDAFLIIKAICTAECSPERIVYRDAQSYFAILFDDNNRKPICRLYFTDKKLQIGIFDETKTELTKIDDLYKLTEELKKIVKYYIELEN